MDSYDVVIAGSGSSGDALAGRLTQISDKRVLSRSVWSTSRIVRTSRHWSLGMERIRDADPSVCCQDG